MSWRIPVVLVVLALLGWVGYEIGRAGDDIVVPKNAGPNTFVHGSMHGKRIDGRSWSLDYDEATMSPDGSYIRIPHVHDGRLHREGKSDVLMTADDVTANTTSNDIQIGGDVKFTEQEGPGRTRTFVTKGAHYNGFTHELTLAHTATITEGGTTVVVAGASVNFRTGSVTLGPLKGTKT
ncbi:MAG TPA: LPS export ABC transporter periplasmic protein LptC [Candidatus Elarobacter sp.]|nr:LPS export ABC transporter periplasmic protein LptC [Candidatus Elarobacter sp.]